MPEIVISVDRTMMSNHHGKEFLGFLATGPSVLLPEWLWLKICCPKPKVIDNLGRPLEAPYGLRKIEAKLIDAGFNAAVIDPDYLHKHVKTAKLLLIGHHDFFAFGPPSSEWWLITGMEPVNRKSFIKFMESHPVNEMRRRGVKIVVGGPAAWQWWWEPELWERWKIVTVIDGEAEKVVVDVVDKLLRGEPVPSYVYIGPHEVPSIDEIPIIKAPSVNGLVEIMRGCPRGCRFCSVTLRPLRFIPVEKIVEEVKVNKKFGIDHVILHSEDVLLYGAEGVIPREEPLLKLHKAVLPLVNDLAWAHASLAAIVVAQRRGRLVTKLTDLIYSSTGQDYLGVEVGIETGSPRLAKIIMPAKAAPFTADEWPDVVEEAFAIMHEHNIIPAATFILGFPEERPDDVVKTIELLERLRPYRSIIVPMLFVPMGVLKGSRAGVARMKLLREHAEAMRVAFWHTVKWAHDIMSRFYLRGTKHVLTRTLLSLFVRLAMKKMREIERKILPQFEERELSLVASKTV
ncbi:MAG: radical SAM protein [Thermoprotei archaeon]|nr:MAG: radical SAM protein [Thermoprotei archaeon]